MFLVVGHQVCTHIRSDFVLLLFADPLQVIKVSRLTFGNSNLHIFSMGLRSGDWLGHSRTLMCFFLSHSFVALAVCFWSLSCWNTHPRPIFNALAGINALALTVHGPVHHPFDVGLHDISFQHRYRNVHICDSHIAGCVIFSIASY